MQAAAEAAEAEAAAAAAWRAAAALEDGVPLELLSLLHSPIGGDLMLMLEDGGGKAGGGNDGGVEDGGNELAAAAAYRMRGRVMFAPLAFEATALADHVSRCLQRIADKVGAERRPRKHRAHYAHRYKKRRR